jgi:hypothetical protein
MDRPATSGAPEPREVRERPSESGPGRCPELLAAFDAYVQNMYAQMYALQYTGFPLLHAREAVVVGVGPAEHDLQRAALAPAVHRGAARVEPQQVDRLPPVLVHRVDRRDDVAAGQLDHGHRLFDPPGRDVDLGEAPSPKLPSGIPSASNLPMIVVVSVSVSPVWPET